MRKDTTNRNEQQDLDGDRYGLVADYRTDADVHESILAHLDGIEQRDYYPEPARQADGCVSY